MNAKIYVGNLNYDVADGDLADLFKTYGTVKSAKVIMDQYTGRAKGFGFVEMSTGEEAENAINGLNGTEHMGRNLKVNEARERKREFSGGGAGGRGGFGGGGGNRRYER